jgi:PNKP adenylyltransferase domain, C-terminal region
VRLRERGLGGKRALALREFALGHEALARFTACAPLRRVHECVFAIWPLRASRLIHGFNENRRFGIEMRPSPEQLLNDPDNFLMVATE